MIYENVHCLNPFGLLTGFYAIFPTLNSTSPHYSRPMYLLCLGKTPES